MVFSIINKVILIFRPIIRFIGLIIFAKEKNNYSACNKANK